MSQRFTVQTTADSTVNICTAPADKIFTVISVIIDGGENGGELAFSFDNGAPMMRYSISSYDVVHLSELNLNINHGEVFKVTGTTDGVTVSVSVLDMAG